MSQRTFSFGFVTLFLRATMNHPRYSVLSLFDPLATPTKETDSDRDVATPDSAAGSDKENAIPHYSGPYNSKHGDSDELTMTAFFNRTYKTQPSHLSSIPLRRRLIDVGRCDRDD
ncbi:hypothetical protein EDD15DRAFT_214190 [Pisolithus albus]|nr:hypothetical protein EDD15DRAFT_214190 [Pisolithus albus]